MSDRFHVVLETGSKRAFARAVDWPGWCRSGRTEADALEALAAYAGRYAGVVGGGPFAAVHGPEALGIVERVEGGATTDFGAPGAIAQVDRLELDDAATDRLAAILRSCWEAFDRAAERARGVELRKGPRGGGRDLAKIVEHVTGAESGYLVALGARLPKDVGLEEAREAVDAAFRATASGEEPTNPSGSRKRWPPRYFVHRAAWHVLDHAWEIEDRSA